MSLQSFKIAKSFTRVLLFLFAFNVQVKVKAWEVDMSRRQKELSKSRVPASIVDEAKTENPSNLLTHFFDSIDPTQEIVIINTPNGFVPSAIRLKKGMNYKIHIVNVNDKQKNSSFILEAFSEHHATYFGQEKNFTVSPKAEGIFSFQCPETAHQGKIIVFTDSERKPASQ